MQNKRELSFAKAILEATDTLLQIDSAVYLIGLGVPDPKGIFGTTVGLQEKFGPDRVMDMPASENGMMGIVIGSALGGMKPIMTHQRVDFFLLALDQLINNGAKWHYMFGGQKHIPIVIRLVIGKGWGQGPQHSQSFQSLFSHIPGLKVVAPSTPYDAKGLLLFAVKDLNPVIYLEHRWLHSTYGIVPETYYEIPIGQASKKREGKDVTIVTSSYMTVEALKASSLLEEEGISAEIIDLRSLKPLDTKTIIESVQKTGHLVTIDLDWKTHGFSAEILAVVSEKAFDVLKKPPLRIAPPDSPCPTSWKLANHFYPTGDSIAMEILQMLGHLRKAKNILETLLHQKNREPLDKPVPSFGPL